MVHTRVPTHRCTPSSSLRSVPAVPPPSCTPQGWAGGPARPPPFQGRFYLPACSLPAVPSLPSEPDIYILIFSREAMRCGASVCIVVAHNVK